MIPNSETNVIAVSVFMITYNHEKFIAQALDGVLMQKTTFNFEIVIGEDCSQDKTREIISKYSDLHPGKFKLLFHEKNLGIMSNQITTINACSGKYIAMCEGDDYWTDPNKLQSQVNLLQNNADYIACFHNVEVIDSSGTALGLVYEPGRKSELNINDLLNGDYMKTCSLMFRNDKDLLEPLLSMAISASDTSLGYCLLMNNSAKYLSEVMAVYRINEGGVWALLSQEHRNTWALDTAREHYRYFYENSIMQKGLKKKLLQQLGIKIKIEIKRFNLKGTLQYFVEFIRYNYLKHH